MNADLALSQGHLLILHQRIWQIQPPFTDKGKWSNLRQATRTELALAEPNKSQELLGTHASSRR